MGKLNAGLAKFLASKKSKGKKVVKGMPMKPMMKKSKGKKSKKSYNFKKAEKKLGVMY